jgi:hypothetical protein
VTAPPTPSVAIGLATDASLGVAFGMAICTPDTKLPPGLLAAVAGELTRRGRMPDITAAMGAELSRKVAMRVSVDKVRARRSARSPSPQSGAG